jgi:hypothetical protein
VRCAGDGRRGHAESNNPLAVVRHVGAQRFGARRVSARSVITHFISPTAVENRGPLRGGRLRIGVSDGRLRQSAIFLLLFFLTEFFQRLIGRVVRFERRVFEQLRR